MTRKTRWSDSGDLAHAIALGVLAALARSPESDHLVFLVILFTHLVCHFDVVLVGPPRSR